jgi:hypothetical protein
MTALLLAEAVANKVLQHTRLHEPATVMPGFDNQLLYTVLLYKHMSVLFAAARLHVSIFATA